jgi:hypothetical protein
MKEKEQEENYAHTREASQEASRMDKVKAIQEAAKKERLRIRQEHPSFKDEFRRLWWWHRKAQRYTCEYIKTKGLKGKV